jgi:hypothetical protein
VNDAAPPTALDLSVVLPVHNEQGSLPALHAAIVRVLGLMAEIMTRVYHEGQGRRIYATARIVRGNAARERP